MKPKRHFIVTIDTEGDNLWAKKESPGTENARFLPRFQQLCEHFGFPPVYLTDYQMAQDSCFREFAQDTLQRRACEIGMHLHAWSTPPIRPLTANDYARHPYLINFSEAVMREKIQVMTDILGESFGRRPVSHRAGRWAIDATYVRLLGEHGYTVDCSVTPHVLWGKLPSHDGRPRGADYRGFPSFVYQMDQARIDRAGGSGVWQVPMTTFPLRDRWHDWVRPWMASIVGRFGPRTEWLRPNGGNLNAMLRLIERVKDRDCIQFMLHSSELMPGGSPTFPDISAIERLYADLQILFSAISAHGFTGCTLAGLDLVPRSTSAPTLPNRG